MLSAGAEAQGALYKGIPKSVLEAMQTADSRLRINISTHVLPRLFLVDKAILSHLLEEQLATLATVGNADTAHDVHVSAWESEASTSVQT